MASYASGRVSLRLGLLTVLLQVSIPVAAGQGSTPVANDTVSLHLESLIESVRASNPSLRAARLEADALATRPRQVSSMPDPQAGVSYRPFAIGGIDGAAPAGVAVSQMVPYPGKLRLAGEAARLGAQMSRLEADELLLELEYQVRESYAELVRLQEQDRLIAHFQERLSEYERVASAQYEVGTGTQQAILKAQLERTALARRRLDLSATRRMHLERLALLTNRHDLVGATSYRLERLPIESVRVPSVEPDVTIRPEIRAMETGIAMSEAEIAMARREYLPDFMIGAGIMDMMGPGAAAMPLDDLGSRLAVEFGVVIPLRRGRRDAALEEARLRRSQYEARLEALQLEIRAETNELENRLNEDEKALALYQGVLVPQAETTLEATLSAYTTGRTDFLDLLDAQRMLFDLRMDHEETYADYVRTGARLLRVLGSGLTETSPSLNAGVGAPARER